MAVIAFTELKLDKPVKTAKLLIKINTVKHIPGWHPGKGNHAWMFIDEIKSIKLMERIRHTL